MTFSCASQVCMPPRTPCIIWESASRAGGGTKMRSATKAGRQYFLPQIWNVAQSLAFQTWSYEDCFGGKLERDTISLGTPSSFWCLLSSTLVLTSLMSTAYRVATYLLTQSSNKAFWAIGIHVAARHSHEKVDRPVNKNVSDVPSCWGLDPHPGPRGPSKWTQQGHNNVHVAVALRPVSITGSPSAPPTANLFLPHEPAPYKK